MLREGRFSLLAIDSKELLITKPTKRRPEEKIRELYKTASAASIGLEMGLAVALGWFIGQWIDDKLGTSPYLMLLFLMFGVAAGFKGVIRVAMQAAEEEPGEHDER